MQAEVAMPQLTKWSEAHALLFAGEEGWEVLEDGVTAYVKRRQWQKQMERAGKMDSAEVWFLEGVVAGLLQRVWKQLAGRQRRMMLGLLTGQQEFMKVRMQHQPRLHRPLIWGSGVLS